MSGLIQNLGHVKACHDPRRDMCPHNADPLFNCDCVSGKKVVRKPFKTVNVTDPQADRAHNIVAEIHMANGMLVLRQKGRRKRVSVTLGALYERLIFNEAMRSAREAKKARRARRGK